MQTLFSKMAIVTSAFFLAVTELVDSALETAGKVGTMGMQTLLALMLLVLGGVIWYQEKRRTTDREARDKALSDQYVNLLTHHENFAKEATVERSGFHLEMKAHAVELRGLTERSIVAMACMATATDALRGWLAGDRRLPRQRTFTQRASYSLKVQSQRGTLS